MHFALRLFLLFSHFEGLTKSFYLAAHLLIYQGSYQNRPSEIFKKPSKDIIRRFKYASSTGGKALSLRFESKDVECFVVDKNIKLSEKLPVSKNAMTFNKRSSAPREILSESTNR